MEDLIGELRDMKPGWAGPGTMPPAPWMVENLRTLLDRDLPDARSPDEVEVDPDDGAITLYWNHRCRKRTFSLSFQARSSVIGVLSDLEERTGYPPWRLPINDRASLQERLDHPAVKSMITINEQNRRERDDN